MISIGQATSGQWAIAGIGDFNGDRTSDVLLQNLSTGWVGAWIINNGAIGSVASIGQALPSAYTVDCIGDFEGTGTSDVLLQNNTTGWVGAWIVVNGATTVLWESDRFSHSILRSLCYE